MTTADENVETIRLDGAAVTVRMADDAMVSMRRSGSVDDTKASVQKQFGRQAGQYARSPSHASDRDLDVLIQNLHLSRDDRVLDVATGTGFTAIALRPHVHAVVGLDLTRGMLAEARRLSVDRSIAWIEGDVEALPFGAASFTIVTCRRAPHHFPRLDLAMAEMLRVLRSRGRLGIVDQVPPEEEAGCELMETLEVLRDSSHVRSLRASEWRTLLDRSRVNLTFWDVIEVRYPFEQWLNLAGTERPRLEEMERTLANATGNARAQIGYDPGPPRMFFKRWIVAVGRKGQ